MNDDNGFGVPAGWYPDPLGLPQMRWWDNHGWTEHTTEARAPIVIQEAKLAWADDDFAADELPTRREMRERERGSSASDGTVGSSAPLADSLLELEPPSWDLLPADEPAPAVLPMPEFVASVASVPEPTASVPAAPAAPAQPTFVEPPVAEAQPVAQPVAVAVALPGVTTNTAGAWIMALMPLAQLVITLLIVSSAGAGGTNLSIVAGVWLAPYLVSIPFAISDTRALKRKGFDRPASWIWVLLSAPVYLAIRAVSLLKKAANGFGPVLVWGALVLLQVGSIVAVPGIVISALPQVFAQEAAASIQHDAAVFGPLVTVKCPAPPATVMGQQFNCTLYKVGSGQTYKVTASLVRQSGWLGWQVDDWGNYTLSR